MRERLQYIAASLLSPYLSEPSAARGQAIGWLGQTLAQQAVAAGYREALMAVGPLLLVVLAGVLLFKYRSRHAGQRKRDDLPRSPVRHAVSPIDRLPLRSRPSGFAAILAHAGWHVPFRVAVALAIGLAAPAALAAAQDSPLGTWSTANGHGVVAIEDCGDALCGRIVGIGRKPSDPMPTDVEGRPQCGLTIITNQRPQPDGTWLGQVIDPRDGGVYQSKLWLDGQGNLRLRGFIGIPALGATQTWHRFTGHLTAACGLA